ncbi:MAG TPA: LytTR family DNA-binding domain-containing protein [Cyclobacteriaceae bacterium]|nr:LytTR family DNA-binding domain-containing protein [Cyclobacteriaceae bacterium]
MKVLVIEDEPLVAKDLLKIIARVDPDAEVIAMLSGVSEAHKWFDQHPAPDLILSDIQLSDGISFEIFESRKLKCPVIFTTAYDEYAIRAFKLNSIDYLLKPIDEKELVGALEKYRSLSAPASVTDQIKVLMSGWGKEQKKYKERFLSIQRNAMVPINQKEIGFFHKEELIFIHTMDNEKMIGEHQTLDEIESLIDPSVFFRVNRQYIIHMQTVARIKTTHKGLTVQLKHPFNLELDISREKATAFKDWLA